MMMPGSPRVTVVIPVYNRERFLAAAIDSVLGQRFRDFELLLVDDGSTDRATIELLERYAARPKVRLLRNDRNLGIPAAHNRALEDARGEYIAMLDSDDIALPERLGRQVAFLDGHPAHAAVGSWTRNIDAGGHASGRAKRLPANSDDARVRYLFRAGMQHASIMARRPLLAQARYDGEHYALCADFDLFARIAARHPVANLAEVLVHRRQHAGRATMQHAQRLRTEKQAVAAAQLDALGMTYGPDDLPRHYRLARPGAAQAGPGAEDMDWAEDWLLRLMQANRASARHDPRALARLIGVLWARQCWSAGAWARAARPSLRGALVRGALASIMRFR